MFFKMDKHFEIYMCLFLCMIIHYTHGNDLVLKTFVSNWTMNWTESAQFCVERGSTLVSSPTQTQTRYGLGYWTRNQRRMSPWIHVIGCFNETQIHQLLTVEKVLTSTPVVTCQQSCANYTFFGLQDTGCVCLSGHFSVGDTSNPSLCNTPCSESSDAVLNDCGGPGTFSIYKTGDLSFPYESDKNNAAMVLKCSGTPEERRFIYLQSLNSQHTCLCRRSGFNNTDLSIKNWADCYRHCRSLEMYVHGEYDILNPVSECLNIPNSSKIPSAWVGIAKQEFYSSSLESSFSLLLQCETCHQGIRSFTYCSDQNNALCEKTSTKTTTRSSSLAPTTETSESSSLAPTTETSRSSSLAPTTVELGGILLAVCGTIIVVVAATGVVVFLARRRKRNSIKRGQSSFRGQSDGASANDERMKKTNGYNNVELNPVKRELKYFSQDNIGYDCLSEAHQQKYGINFHTYINSNPASSKRSSHEDPSYDLLWQTPSTAAVDNTYNYIYDVTNHGTTASADDTYNHTDGAISHGFAATADDHYSHIDCATKNLIFSTADDTYNHTDGATSHGFAATADDYYSHTDCDTNNGKFFTADDTYNHAGGATSHGFAATADD